MLKSFCVNIEILCLFNGTRCEPFKKKLYSSWTICSFRTITTEEKLCLKSL